ncbi:hypothetical protein C9374_003669 [Naegleria lovaniensis]|uniref:GCS light chain n=1 Tax=Naegleria lovaniensis TaxID=51637 RepID=A0AA88GZN7_NAELO|nr:uncharacterized protein C9374_003669 [Naegleria lovaniensis]KAG2393905.1 hypothetical protein C9374_003669 [Naegleria lovaniensis]
MMIVTTSTMESQNNTTSTSTAAVTTVPTSPSSSSCCSAAAIILKASNLSQHEALSTPEQYETFLDETLLTASSNVVCNKPSIERSAGILKNVLVEQFQQYQASDDEYSLSVQLFLDASTPMNNKKDDSCSFSNNELAVISAVINTLQELKRAHIDMLLIKATSPQQVLNYWSDVELLVEYGLVKQIGVCDFSVNELQTFMSSSQIKIQPQIVQVNLASYETLESLNDLTQFCASRNIKVLTGSRGSLNDFRKAGAKALGSSQVSLDYVVRYSLVSRPTSVVKDMGFIVKVNGNEKCECISGQCL